MSGSFAPSGKPITVQTFTPLPRRAQAASRTQIGFMQTEANPISHAFFAYFQYFVASGIGFEQSVIDVASHFARGFAFGSGEPKPHAAFGNQRAHAIRAFNKALVVVQVAIGRGDAPPSRDKITSVICETRSSMFGSLGICPLLC